MSLRLLVFGVGLGLVGLAGGCAAEESPGAEAPAAWTPGVWTREITPAPAGSDRPAYADAIDTIETETTTAWTAAATRYDAAATRLPAALEAGAADGLDPALVDELVKAEADMRAAGLSAVARTFVALAPPGGPGVDLDGTEPVLPFFPQVLVASVAANRRSLAPAARSAGVAAAPEVAALLVQDAARVVRVGDAIEAYRVAALGLDYERADAATKLAGLAEALVPALDASFRERLQLGAALLSHVPADERASLLAGAEFSNFLGIPTAKGGRSGILAGLAAMPAPRARVAERTGAGTPSPANGQGAAGQGGFAPNGSGPGGGFAPNGSGPGGGFAPNGGQTGPRFPPLDGNTQGSGQDGPRFPPEAGSGGR